jgi:hypothetical protein
VRWEPATKSDHVYLNIDRTLSVRRDLFKERLQFWNDMMGRHDHQ